jgi:Zn-dependent protease with chaperone function
MSIHTAPDSLTTVCSNCAAVLPVDPGFVAWCDQCGWNVQPTAPAEVSSLLGRAFAAFGRRSGQQLFEQLVGRSELRPGQSTTGLLAFLVAGLVHCITLALALGGVALIVGTWFNLGPMLLGALMLALAWALRPRLAQLKETPLERGQAPTLYRLLDQVADALGHPRVDTLVIDQHFNASYARVGWRGRPVVTLGLPLLAVLTPQQQVALIAHELGHGVNGDPLRSSMVGTALGALQGWYDMLHPRAIWQPEQGLMAYLYLVSNLLMLGLAQLAYGATYLLALLAWRSSQRAEYLADDLAARVAGAEAMLELLAATQWHGVIELVVQGIALGRGEGELVGGLEQAAAALPLRERERLRRAAMLEGARLDATHPPTALRATMIERRSHDAPLVTVEPELEAALRAELRALEGPIRRRLVEEYRARLYAQ